MKCPDRLDGRSHTQGRGAWWSWGPTEAVDLTAWANVVMGFHGSQAGGSQIGTWYVLLKFIVELEVAVSQVLGVAPRTPPVSSLIPESRVETRVLIQSPLSKTFQHFCPNVCVSTHTQAVVLCWEIPTMHFRNRME